MSKRIPLVLILLFILSAITVNFHHHDDGTIHDDCPACVLGIDITAICAQDSYETPSNDYVLLQEKEGPIIPFSIQKFSSGLSPPNL